MRHTCLLPIALLSAYALLFPATVESQQRPATPNVNAIGDTITVVPGPEYRVGGLRRALLGSGWRDVWLTSIAAPVFDLGTYAGGVEIIRLGGGFQTVTLHLIEAEGWREHRYRSVNKSPEQRMSMAIQGTLSGAVLQDQVSTLFPAASLLVPPLLEAIGALHVPADLYIMPDDPRLGEHRATFAGMLGTVEEKPDEAPGDEPGFAGSRKVKGTANFFDDIEDSRVHRLDEREFLAVRFIDFLINDTDRTADNFEWARFETDDETYLWRPVPRDRDRAFMDARGWLNSLVVRRFYPKLVKFEPSFSLDGLTHTSYPLDRRLLQRLTRADFEQIALNVQRAISDDVIEAVIAELPERWRTQTTAPERLRHVLAARRDNLPDVALEFYRDLAGEVDIHGTAEDELADVVRHGTGAVTVTITGRDEAELAELVRHVDGRVTLVMSEAASADRRQPFYERTFLPDETKEIRVHLGAGDDLAVIRGAATGGIVLRIIGGAGDDVLVDSAGGGATYFYDAEGDNSFVVGDGTRVRHEPWTPPHPAGGLRLATAWSPDWGGSSGWSPVFDYVAGNGLVIGYGPDRVRYGFRRLPHRWSAGAKLLVAPGTGRLAVTAGADYRTENSPLAFTLAATASQLEPVRFHGYGNATASVPRAEALVQQNTITVKPAFVWHIGWRTRDGLADPLRGEETAVAGVRPLVGRLEAGPVMYWSNPAPPEGSPLDVIGAPRGDAFGRAGFRIGLELDRTDSDPVPTRGWTFNAAMAGYAPVWDAVESFSTAEAVGSAYVPLASDGPHLALRAGAALASGPAAVQHAPAIGGRSTLRGHAWRRYTGDTSAYGSTELRVPTGSVSLFVRWDMGLFGLADAGRVWHDGRSDGGWHTGLGGGFWMSSLGKAVSVAYARGEEHRLYLSSGLAF
jgi:hypothetical protein